MQEKISKLRAAKEKALLGGGREKIEAQHQRGKLTAQERVDKLLDAGSFFELYGLAGHEKGRAREGVLAGYGTISGRPVCIFAQDTTVMGGSIGVVHNYKICRTIESALEMRIPLIGLFDSGGARAAKLESSDEGDLTRPRGYDEGRTVFFPNTQASGIVPQIAAILGNCAGIAVYSPALMDFIFMVDELSHMFITGPAITKTVLGEEVTMEELGGARVHTRVSGVADLRVESEDICFQKIKTLLGFLPQNCDEPPPVGEFSGERDRMNSDVTGIVPFDPYKAYDVHRLIESIVDYGEFFEIKPEFAAEMVVGFGRLGGQSVGIVANQPMVRAGSLTVDSSDKQARFIRFCDAFNIPIILLVDTPAYQPGLQMERAGIIRHGAKVLYALCESIVPRIVVIVRKLYGGGTLGMSVIPQLGADLVFAWPTAEIALFGAEPTVELLYRDDIKKATDPEKFKLEKIGEYRERYANPIAIASQSTLIHDVIEPNDTRKCLIQSLAFLKTKKVKRQEKRHGNIPL